MKRWLSLLLAALLAAMLVLPVGAAGFSDVNDASTLSAAETLRLMGVIDGFPDGSFRPNGNLTRAQFCKMATYAVGAQTELSNYRTITVFPDVANHWAREYVNLSAKGLKLIAGFPDGTFRPESTITTGQAVTILLRLLGYRDEAIGGIWPTAYMEKAAVIGLTDGTGIADGYAALTRKQAAKLFVRMLQTKTAEGGTYYALSDETTLTGIDGGAGTMTVSNNKTYSMRTPTTETALLGRRGKVVLDSKGNAVTFLTVTSENAAITDVAVVVKQNGSTDGFDILAGGKSYTLYKNGLPITSGDLRVNDTAIYRADTNAILVSDAHLSVRFEGASPSKQQPTVLTTLGGMQLNVMPSAVTELSKRDIGSQINILLTADGQVAGIVDDSRVSTGNTFAYIHDGTLSLCAGGTLIQLAGTPNLKDGTLADFNGKVVRIGAYDTGGRIQLSVASGSSGGVLNVANGTVGGQKIAANALIFDYGKQINLNALTQNISGSAIALTRANWRNEIDLIVLHSGNEPIYGRVQINTDKGANLDRNFTVSNGITTLQSFSRNQFFDGDFVKVIPYEDGSVVTRLEKHEQISSSAWFSNRYLSLNGQTYTAAEDLRCYNAESSSWITLAQACSLYATMNVYTEGSIVYGVEVGIK